MQEALRPPPQRRRKTALGRFFAVGSDPRAYAALFYMVLSLATGIVYFVFTIVGVSLSLGLAILVIGIPVGDHLPRHGTRVVARRGTHVEVMAAGNACRAAPSTRSATCR